MSDSPKAGPAKQGNNKSPAKPSAVFRIGYISVAIFNRQSKLKSGDTIESHNIVIDRSYWSKEEKVWKSTHTIQPEDVMAATIALQRAYEFIEGRTSGERS